MQTRSFIETQFPIARMSAESFKERNAASGQTLTGLGKWWGRKPLVLVRAAILGSLLPSTDDSKSDRETFLRLMTMDEAGLWRRKRGSIPPAKVDVLAPDLAAAYRATPSAARASLERQVWARLSYAEKLELCLRPEELPGPGMEEWGEISAALGTAATHLPALIDELGHRMFGHRPRVGDPFCGGGSIPFEAARLGCDTYGADLNPVAALLTWAGINLIGAESSVQNAVRRDLEKVFADAKAEIDAWGIERSEEGWQAEYYLYCNEVTPPGCAYPIPVAPAWIIGERGHVCARLRLDGGGQRVHIDIINDADAATWRSARTGTYDSRTSRLQDPFDASRSWSLDAIRGPEGLRRWSRDDLVPRPTDVFQERLYCIRWRTPDGQRVYRAPTTFDLANEAKVLRILTEKLEGWRAKKIIPDKAITPGYNTDQPIRERGWTHWHQLFTPRQLLTHGALQARQSRLTSHASRVALLVGVGSAANRDSKLSIWNIVTEGGMQTFSNQALNPLYNWPTRSITGLYEDLQLRAWQYDMPGQVEVRTQDARDTLVQSDLWITDPPYADAVNYHELGDYFLSWYEGTLPILFPEWGADGRGALAVRGQGAGFRQAMVEVYGTLTKHMPDSGCQVVMFTHSDPSVWADLGMIMWAAGLRVTAAWTISTERAAGGLRVGNYVQGTVLLVLRKRLGRDDAFLDELYPMVADEVRQQIDSMRATDDDSSPNFGDTDYQLAAYAAALRVLTQYETIDGIDVRGELFSELRTGRADEKSRFEIVIERAIEIACDYLIPRGLEDQWATLTADERLYLRAVDVESRGERRSGVYQELARGFGVRDMRMMLQSEQANGVRVKTATEFAARSLGGADFAGTLLRRLLFAIHETARTSNPDLGRRYLFDNVGDYWLQRTRLVSLLEWLAQLGQQSGMAHWHGDAEAARLLAGRLFNDHG